MSVIDFKKQLAQCQDQLAVERLLQNWSDLRVSLPELAALRDDVCNKLNAVNQPG